MTAQDHNSVCPKCKKPFNCMADDILKCPCNSIELPAEAKSLIKEKYEGCLCLECLKKLKVHMKDIQNQ